MSDHFMEKPLFNQRISIKKNIFSKPLEFVTTFFNDVIETHCYTVCKNELGELIYRFSFIEIKYSDIFSTEKESYEKNNFLKIKLVFNYKSGVYYLIPLTDSNCHMEEILNDTIEKNKLNEEKHQEEIQKIRREREEERQILEQKKLEEKEFYSSTYQFHIKSNTPFYTFETGINYCSLLYIAEDKSLNFLAIDGNSKQEANGIIPYDHIHYYEKAGTIHYVTEVNASYQEGGSFGGSFKPGQFNIGKSILGGLLFGPMGMAVGTMASYKPSEYTPPQYNPGSFNINSTCTRIDERSVILNYYSDEHKQYMDIELPHDIFNFLQTHYSEKKYDIVIELEKQSAAKTLTPTISPVSDNNNKVLSIKERLANLKDLYENELISLNDYESRKKEILSEM